MKPRDKKRPETIVAVLIEEGAAAGYLMDNLSRTFNKNARVIAISSADIRRKNILAKTDILFIPGVHRASDAYRNNLGQEGGEKIKKWVRKGGTVVGLCQGAYLLTKRFQYADKYSGRIRVIHPSTGIFEGVAHGPVPEYTNREDLENPFIDHAVAKLAFNDAVEGAACYSHGPWLELSTDARPEEYRVIARFRDIPGRPIAMAARRYGKGKAVFSSVVPGISGMSMATADERLLPENSAKAEHWRTGIRFARELAAHEEQRQLVWNRLMAEIRPR